MNKLRVFRNVGKRRKPYGYGSLLLFFLFLPYIVTVLLGNGEEQEVDRESLMIIEQLNEGHYTVINETAIGKESIPFEIYVADRLMRTMEEGYEQEALKAQAVLLRAELIPDEGMSVTVSDESYGKKEIAQEYLMAVMQTRGIYPEYDGKPVYGAYCKVSNGRTRSAKEVLLSDDYPYLEGAQCDREFLSQEYAATVSFEGKNFEKIYDQMEMTILNEGMENEAKEGKRFEEKDNMAIIRDSAGYVLFFRYGDKWVSGEELRYALDLPSASFKVEKEKGTLFFHCTGVGHGLGLSQFAANEMALDGKNYIEILEYFFKGIQFNKIE
ncbi:MAG: SpoIID/LytB domain-containing protein [Suilimivivens sp.]